MKISTRIILKRGVIACTFFFTTISLVQAEHLISNTTTVSHNASNSQSPIQKLVEGAKSQVGKTLIYNGAYVKLDYPNGDVPLLQGVCTDVVIRALRVIPYKGATFDLQKLVHEDMAAHFSDYPKNWGLKHTDKNIDHRRVPNLQTFFTRKGWSQPISTHSKDYKAGDIVSWKFDNGLDHIGIVIDQFSADGTPLIVHNAGQGAQREDVLFAWKITGHYRIDTADLP